MHVELLLAWTLLIVAGIIGAAMVTVGMIEEVPIIMRGTVRRMRQ